MNSMCYPMIDPSFLWNLLYFFSQKRHDRTKPVYSDTGDHKLRMEICIHGWPHKLQDEVGFQCVFCWTKGPLCGKYELISRGNKFGFNSINLPKNNSLTVRFTGNVLKFDYEHHFGDLGRTNIFSVCLSLVTLHPKKRIHKRAFWARQKITLIQGSQLFRTSDPSKSYQECRTNFLFS